jgi:EAL domain-containing protein (putative c-di-GMP-specific phosphodiesterase class I)
MEANNRNLDIVRTIVGLAHNLGMKVIAEGAETSTQVNSLKSMSCDFVQGYFYSRPLDPAAIESLLAPSSDKLRNSRDSSELLPEPVEI